MKSIFLPAAVAALALCASCATDSNKWHIKGSIDGLSKTDIVVLEGNNQGYWYLIDTIKPAKDGSFKYSREAQGYPDIYRLRIGEKNVYFPIDSVETITLNASMPDPSTNHTLAGSDDAVRLARVDSLIQATAAAGGRHTVVTDTLLKRNLGRILLENPSGIVAYYLISKNVDGKPLFNPANRTDHRYIGAVANSFNHDRPDDPRTNYLKNLYISNRPRAGVAADQQFEAKVIGAFDIQLYDTKGVRRSLLDIAKDGKVALLSFTAYGQDWSPAFNVELNNVYTKYRDRGFEIYQVSLDQNDYLWKETARNLPWITVISDVTDGARAMRDYNVGALPTTFVINRKGEIVERVLTVEEIDPAVARHL